MMCEISSWVIASNEWKKSSTVELYTSTRCLLLGLSSTSLQKRSSEGKLHDIHQQIRDTNELLKLKGAGVCSSPDTTNDFDIYSRK